MDSTAVAHHPGTKHVVPDCKGNDLARRNFAGPICTFPSGDEVPVKILRCEADEVHVCWDEGDGFQIEMWVPRERVHFGRLS